MQIINCIEFNICFFDLKQSKVYFYVTYQCRILLDLLLKICVYLSISGFKPVLKISFESGLNQNSVFHRSSFLIPSSIPVLFII